MEFHPRLSAFQGVLISADNVHSFSGLTSKAGNEDEIKYIVEKVSKFLIEVNLITENGVKEDTVSDVRKLAFFITLNSELSVLSEMTDMDEIDSVIWTIPTIPKCLMCEIFWRLDFDMYVWETIALSYPELGMEVASAFIENIKYFTPNECLKKIKIISSAIYRLICRLVFFKFSESVLTDKCTMALSSFQKCINYFTEPPRAEKLNTLSKDQQYKHIGTSLYTMLLLIEDCLKQFSSKQDLNPLNDSLYKLTYIGDTNENIEYKICDTPNEIILDCFTKCNAALLEKYQELVMNVSVDIFCAWSEFDNNGKSEQKVIGELCYKVRNTLLSIPSLSEHPVVDMTLQISCKPIELNDIIGSASMDSIKENVQSSSEEKVVWLRALLDKEEIYTDEAAIRLISSNLNLLEKDKCYVAYKRLRNYIANNSPPSNVEYLECYLVKLFQKCDINARHEILKEYFNNNCFKDMVETAEFNIAMTETFNKLVISQNEDLTEMLALFLQSPRKVFSKIFSLAIENAHQSSIMLEAMKMLKDYSNHYYSSDTEPCIIKVIQGCFDNLDTEPKKVNYISFVCSLKHISFITGAKLLLLIVMPNIHKALINKDIKSINIQCKQLRDAYTLEELLEYRAPMLAMLGQVLDVVRWKINTFDPIAPTTVQLALDLQFTLFNTYSSGIPDNEYEWLKSKLRNMPVLNMYYYKKLWNPPGRNYAEIITGLQIHSGMCTVQLVTRLSQALCSTTQHEWCKVWNSLSDYEETRRLEIFHESLFLITMVERGNRSDATWSCVLYCYKCFIYIIRYKFFKEPINRTQVEDVLEKLVITCNFAQDDNAEELSAVIIPLLAYLAERRNDYDFDALQYLRSKLKHPNFIVALTKVFTNCVN